MNGKSSGIGQGKVDSFKQPDVSKAKEEKVGKGMGRNVAIEGHHKALNPVVDPRMKNITEKKKAEGGNVKTMEGHKASFWSSPLEWIGSIITNFFNRFKKKKPPKEMQGNLVSLHTQMRQLEQEYKEKKKELIESYEKQLIKQEQMRETLQNELKALKKKDSKSEPKKPEELAFEELDAKIFGEVLELNEKQQGHLKKAKAEFEEQKKKVLISSNDKKIDKKEKVKIHRQLDKVKSKYHKIEIEITKKEKEIIEKEEELKNKKALLDWCKNDTNESKQQQIDELRADVLMIDASLGILNNEVKILRHQKEFNKVDISSLESKMEDIE